MVKRGKSERMLRQILSFANVTVSMSVPDVEKYDVDLYEFY